MVSMLRGRIGTACYTFRWGGRGGRGTPGSGGGSGHACVGAALRAAGCWPTVTHHTTVYRAGASEGAPTGCQYAVTPATDTHDPDERLHLPGAKAAREAAGDVT
jgi:hypothetical protein